LKFENSGFPPCFSGGKGKGIGFKKMSQKGKCGKGNKQDAAVN
jgi:hypothetical protein